MLKNFLKTKDLSTKNVQIFDTWSIVEILVLDYKKLLEFCGFLSLDLNTIEFSQSEGCNAT